MEASRRSTLAEFSMLLLQSIKSAKKGEAAQEPELSTSALDLPESSFARQVASGMLKFRGTQI